MNTDLSFGLLEGLGSLSLGQDSVEVIANDTPGRVRVPTRPLRDRFGDDETFPLRRIDDVLSEMLTCGNKEYVRNYLDFCPEPWNLIHGITVNGNSALCLAASEEFPAVVELLLARGAKVNFQNKDGRTPLMEAALWGHYENVRHLLKYGADKSLLDSHGFTAAYLASFSDRNEEERYRRDIFKFHREFSPLHIQERRKLLRQLDDARDNTFSYSNMSFENLVFQKSQGILKLVALVAEYPISTDWKTIARLERGPGFSSVTAMSGWSHGRQGTTLPGGIWTDLVSVLAYDMGYH